MVIIKDKSVGHEKLPLASFLMQVKRHFRLDAEVDLSVIRFGGLGDKVWSLECVLEQSGSLSLKMRQLLLIAEDQSQEIDELCCIHDTAVFGLADATFLFVQSQDREAERAVANAFKLAEEIPDRNFSLESG